MSDQYRYFGAFRLLLALMVVTQHAVGPLGPSALSAAIVPLEVGGVAVLLFFVLSGFIVVEAASLFYEGRAPAFLTNRIIRIYPPYVAAVLLTVLVTEAVIRLGGGEAAVALFYGSSDHSLRNVLMSLISVVPFATKALEPSGTQPILVLAWALRIELVFYAVVFCALLAGRALHQPLARMLGVIGVGMLGFYAVNFAALKGGGLEYTPYFVFGVSIYYAITPASARRRLLAAGLVAMSGFLIAAHIAGQSMLHEKAGFARDLPLQLAIFTAGIAIWLALVFAPRFRPVGAGLRRFDQMLGDMTYPLYLTHMAALLPCVWIAGSLGLMVWPVALVAVLIMASATHTLLEKPLSALRARIRGQSLVAHRSKFAASPPMTLSQDRTAA